MTVVFLLGIDCQNDCGTYGKRHMAENALRHDLFEMRKAIDNFYADKSRYPTSLRELVQSHYLYEIPRDPMTNRSDTWTCVHSKNQCFDVRSGAKGQGCDRSSYDGW